MISIVIPTLNSEKYLDKCLQSIFSQSYKNFEVIIVDSFSTDNTQKMLSRYRIHLVHQKPRGEPAAINLGIELAKGDIVTYIDSDDTYEPNCFTRVVEAFNNPETQWLYGIGNIIDSNGSNTRNVINSIKRLFYSRYNYNTYKLFNYIVQPTVFLRKSFYDRVGRFDTKLKYVFDYDYWFRAGAVSKPMFVNWHLANWRAHDSSITAGVERAETRQALEVQSRYSSVWYRPIQWLSYITITTLYSILNVNIKR